MTIRKRKDRDGWLVQVELHGERRRRQVGDKWEAQRVERDMRRSLEAGRTHHALGEVLNAYTASLQAQGKTKNALKQARFQSGILTGHFGPHFDLAEMDQKALDRFIMGQRARNLKNTSINTSLRILRAAMRAAMGHGAPYVRLLTELRKLPSILSIEDVELLVEHGCSEAGLAVLIAAHAGLRHQEILHLTAYDVRDGEIRVTAKHGWQPKAHAERAVPINRRLATALEPVVRDRVGWLFPGENGRPLATLDRKVRKAFRAAGLWDPKIRPGLHMLRRTFASRLLGAGVDIETVRELGGWANLDVVQRYLASTDDLKRRAVAMLEG